MFRTSSFNVVVTLQTSLSVMLILWHLSHVMVCLLTLCARTWWTH